MGVERKLGFDEKERVGPRGIEGGRCAEIERKSRRYRRGTWDESECWREGSRKKREVSFVF